MKAGRAPRSSQQGQGSRRTPRTLGVPVVPCWDFKEGGLGLNKQKLLLGCTPWIFKRGERVWVWARFPGIRHLQAAR